MRRRLAAALATAMLAGGTAAAQEADVEEEGEPGPARLEMGPRLGAQIGISGVSPGGLRVGGDFLYQMTSATWFDTEVAFSFGAGGAECFTSRDFERLCDHGIADGFGFQVLGGVRYHFARREDGFQPFVRGGAGLALARFGDDEVTGVGFPFWAGSGGRFRVADGVAVGGDILLFAGPAILNQDLGVEPYTGLIVQFGVELVL